MFTPEEYADNFSSRPDFLLQQVLDDTNANHQKASMISGRVQGQLLGFISRMIQPLRVLEIGTFTGFSALCLAAGLKDGGLLYTIELRERDAATAQAFFDRSSYSDKIKLLVGDAARIIPGLTETWDLVFIDADKTGYVNYYEQVLPQVRTGGYIIADNVLFHGGVLQDAIKGKNAIAVHTFNEHVKHDDRVEQVLLTIRDGLLLIQKK